MKTKLITLSLLMASAQIYASDTKESLGFSDDANVNINIKRSDPSITDETFHTKGGGLVYDYYAVNGGAFHGRTSNFEGAGAGSGGRNCTDGSTERFIDHEIQMDPNDVLDGIRVWGSDTNDTQDMGLIMYRSCLPAFGADSIFSNVFFSETYTASGGNVSSFFNTNFTFEGLGDDRDECKLMFRIRFGSQSTCNGVENVNLYKIRAQLIKDDLIFKDNMDEY